LGSVGGVAKTYNFDRGIIAICAAVYLGIVMHAFLSTCQVLRINRAFTDTTKLRNIVFVIIAIWIFLIPLGIPTLIPSGVEGSSQDMGLPVFEGDDSDGDESRPEEDV
jgi:hypothetical protein